MIRLRLQHSLDNPNLNDARLKMVDGLWPSYIYRGYLPLTCFKDSWFLQHLRLIIVVYTLIHVSIKTKFLRKHVT